MPYEVAQITAAHRSLYDKELSCGDCQKKYATRPQQFEFKGCTKLVEHVVYKFDDGTQFHKCPGNLANQSAMYWLSVHAHYDKGFLPFPGSVMDQPAKAMEIISLISGLNAEQQLQEAKRQKQKSAGKTVIHGRR